MLLLVVGVMLAGLQVSHQIEYPGPAQSNPTGPNRWYSGPGGFSTSGPGNCPITVCNPLVCPFGRYLAGCGVTSEGDCNSGCTNFLPDHAVWSSNGGTSATACSWACDVNYELNLAATGCVQKTCAANLKGSVQNADFLAGTQGAFPNCNYQCNAGYVGNGTVVRNADNTIRGPAQCDICLAGKAAAAGAPACYACGPGLFSASSGSASCSSCDQLTYSKLVQNTECLPCRACLDAGQFRKNCGGASDGICDTCTNTVYTP
jgi:hypothetical protein